MNVTLDDSAPQIQYFGSWSSYRDPARDSGTPNYYRKTFHSTVTEGDWMRLIFNGTAAWVFGSFWENHGAYTARVDGGSVGTYMGYAEQRRYNQLLFATGGLSPDKEHVLEMTNRPSRSGGDPRPWWFDIDYIVVELPVPEGLTTTVIDDSATRITYSSGWAPRPDAKDGYYNATAHQTTAVNEQFTLPFIGSSIQLYGTISTDTGNYSIAIDGQQYGEEYNGTWYEKRTNSPLFFASGLADSAHTITLTNKGRTNIAPAKQTFEFDYAVVNSSKAALAAADGGGSSGGGIVASGPPTGTGGDTPSLSTPVDGQNSSDDGGSGRASSAGPIAGGVVGGLALVGLLVLGFLWWRKKRSAQDEKAALRARADRLSSNPSVLNGSEVKPFVHGLHHQQHPAAIHGVRSDGSLRATHVAAAAGMTHAMYVNGRHGRGRSQDTPGTAWAGGGPDGAWDRRPSGRPGPEYSAAQYHLEHARTDPRFNGGAGPAANAKHNRPGRHGAPTEHGSEYSGTNEGHPGFAFLMSPPPDLPPSRAAKDSNGARNLARPSSPSHSAYSGYESTGTVANTRGAKSRPRVDTGTGTGTGWSASAGSGIRGGSPIASSGVFNPSAGTGTGTGSSHWSSEAERREAAQREKDLLRINAFHQPDNSIPASVSVAVSPRSSPDSTGRSPGSTRSHTDLLRSAIRAHSQLFSSQGPDAMEMVDERSSPGGASASHARSAGRGRHTRDGSLSSLTSLVSPSDIPLDAPPGYTESVSAHSRRDSRSTRQGTL